MARSYSALKNYLVEFLLKFAAGAGAGAAGDWAVETFKIPGLNNVGTFGNKNMSNYEYAIFGLGALEVGATFYDYMGAGSKLLKYNRHALPIALGAMFGTYFYEHTLVNMFHIRKFDPYQLLGHLVPPSMPHPLPPPPPNAPPGPHGPPL
jgi:hypothetical protein